MSFFNKKNNTVNNKMFIGKGFSLDDKKHEKLVNIYLEDDNCFNHSFVFGSTGVGKTRLIEGLIEQDIPKQNNIVIIDPKGDIGLFSKVVEIAKKHNRENDLLFLSPIYPDYSIKINPLKNYSMEEEIISHIVASVPAKEEFFYNIALETTTVIVKSLLIIRRYNKDESALNFDEVSSKASYNGLKDLRETLENIKDDTEEEREVEKILETLTRVIESPADYFSKVSSTLRTTLTQMTTGNVGKIMGNTFNNVFIDRLEKDEGVILYVMTGSLLTRQVSSIISKVTLSMIQSCVGRIYSSGKKFKNPLKIYIDEAASSLYRGIEVIYAQARGAKVAMMGLTQSAADIVAEIGQDSTNKLLELTNTKIIMRLNDTKSAKVISDLGGKRKDFSYFLSLNGGINSREVEELNIEIDDVTNLQKREFYYFGFEGRFKGKTLRVKDGNLLIQMPDLTSK
ncbi:DNA transfer in the process of conjugation and F pilus assembly protein [Campylobacter insulaenigrae]|uniref:type IV secretory system conjugative DNA transfer family protein n=1 Tax=Campylobacter insulaenigrae TaxID=260714 RepID=UPI000F6B3F49|nr:type IV secretory system conjugative DNA transfer family protein [Campylobacter insulaenigrae]MCR6574318.1 type IV secretion system DNA-binding domain-containing protein [Campylobacter insulaenigrae]MCR6590514.1 type IV secretion system DNA-binding domain-containing protein [Campylobacter insulaenigrae]MCR6592051.1 type IV secretion system DNA-binding domain-containing protein [Campylobacter insulaenigrae]VEJ53339.1 DNA transfer in the process of conjugation and F pilus assembly protein [Cam